MALIKKGGGTRGGLRDKTQTIKQDDTAQEDQQEEQYETREVQTLGEGTVLQGRYVIEGILGVGGMSVVYRGRDLRFKDVVRQCAIKEMYQRAADSHTRTLNLRHFEREAGLLATLNHPAIPKVYDFFEENSRIYLVQELVPGKDLETILEEEGKPFEEQRVGGWAIQICDVLSYLHHHEPEPIVFRDMKPSNVLLTPEERIVLIDFGIARLLDPMERKGTMIGTEGYAPPEQYRGEVEPQGDIYALGATLHHLLSGSDPRLETPFTFDQRPLRKLNPVISEEMDHIISHALKYNADERWETAETFKKALFGIPGMRDVARPQQQTEAPKAPRSSSVTELVWTFTCEDEVRSSPCHHNGLLYVGSYDNNLYALDAATGTFSWKYATEGGISSSPTVWHEIVIVGSEDGSVHGIDYRTGMRRWRFRTEKAVRSSPRVQERLVFIGSDDQNVYALDGLRGVPIWKYRAWAPFRSSPCIGKEDIYIGCDDGNVYCLEMRNANVKWRQRLQSSVLSSPCCSNGMVFVGSTDHHLYALDQQAGVPVWKFKTGHYVNSSPIVTNDFVVVGSADGNVYALEKKNGNVAWTFETKSQVGGSPRHHEGRIYIGATDGFIYCLDVRSGRMIWKHQTEAPVVSSAAIANGMIFIGSMDNRVYALKA